MTKLLITLLMSLGVVAGVHAADHGDGSTDIRNRVQNNFLSKRPYQAPVEREAGSDSQWIGAGIVTDKLPQDKGFDKHQQMKLNFIGKRPYSAE